MDYREQYQRYVAMVEETIEQVLPQTEEECPNEMRIPKRLCEAMRYSLLAGGKRIRPVLLLATCEMLGGDIRQARVPAAALEMIHTYSLIHDDLPGMDNDDYRRGRLTNHKVFGEGFAILAGDGLLNYAYECILNNALAWGENTPGHIRAAQEIARRAGVSGMVAGQSIDLLSERGDAAIHSHAQDGRPADGAAAGRGLYRGRGRKGDFRAGDVRSLRRAGVPNRRRFAGRARRREGFGQTDRHGRAARQDDMAFAGRR